MPFPENHPLALGCAGKSRRSEAVHFLENADLIFGLGTSFTHSEYITPFPTRNRLFIQLTNWEGDISKDYPIDLGIIGDAKATLARMVEILGDGASERRNSVHDEVAAHRKAFMDAWRPLLHSGRGTGEPLPCHP